MGEVDSGSIKGFDIVGIGARDAAPLVAFYRDVLGLQVTKVYPGSGAEFDLSDGATFGIQPTEPSQVGWGALFSLRDITHAVKECRERGAQLTDPMETPVCFMSFGQDPEGNTFIIHQRKAQ